MKWLLAFVVCFAAFHQHHAQGFSIKNALRLLEMHVNKTFRDYDSPCLSDLKKIIVDAREFKLYAIRMIDSSAKFETGVLDGHIRQLGHYDQCLQINENGIRGKYCMAKMWPDRQFILGSAHYLNVSTIDNDLASTHFYITSGMCVPATCNAEDLSFIFSRLSSGSIFRKIDFLDKNCYDSTPVQWSQAAKNVVYAFVFMLIVVALSTYYDCSRSEEDRQRNDNNVLTIFSARINWSKLMAAGSNNEFKFLNGIRTWSMVLILCGHTGMFQMYVSTSNLLYLNIARRDLLFSFLCVGLYSVDTFLFISGFLIGIKAFKKTKPILIFYLHRLLRLFPLLFITVIFTTYVVEYMGHGPSWYHITGEPFADKCKDTWWPVLLFVQNYIGQLESCISFGWHVSVDMQLYLIAPFILYGFKKNVNATLWLLAMALVGSIVYAFYITFTRNLGCVFTQYNLEYYEIFASVTHVRMTPWLVGIFYGYYFNTKSYQKPLSNTSAIIGWIINLAILLGITLSLTQLDTYHYYPLVASFSNAFLRPLWANSIGWVVYACSKGKGWIINDFLSFDWYKIMCKLSYAVYLVHIPMLVIYMGFQRSVSYLSLTNLFMDTHFIMITSIAVSIVLLLMIDVPLYRLEQLYIVKTPAVDKKQKQQPVEAAENKSKQN